MAGSTCGSGDHARCPALVLRVEAVLVAAAAAVPELGAGVGLLVVVPADVVFSTRALVQNQAAARVQGGGLCENTKPAHVKPPDAYLAPSGSRVHTSSEIIGLAVGGLAAHSVKQSCVLFATGSLNTTGPTLRRSDMMAGVPALIRGSVLHVRSI